jgi:hypothetical protein
MKGIEWARISHYLKLNTKRLLLPQSPSLYYSCYQTSSSGLQRIEPHWPQLEIEIHGIDSLDSLV